MKIRLPYWITLACLAVVLAGAGAPARAGVPDAWVSTKVKMLLLNSPRVSGMPIDVDTDEGRVTLHGKVPSTAERVEAERIARAGTGVVSVRNLLQVVPASRRKVVEVADDRLEKEVTVALGDERALANSSIHTKSVNKGVVLLSGKAATLSDHLLALEVASAVPGVRQVASEVESPDEFGDREIWYDRTPDEKADPAAGNNITDGWITAQTKMRFMTDADVPASDIHVDTRRGVVTLFGTVPTTAIGDKAVGIAREVPGVHSVKRELRVVPVAGKKLATAQDDQVESKVRQRLADARMTGSDVKVEVKAGTARLSGTVQQASHRYSAVSIARLTPGVQRVQNDIRVEPTQTSQR